MKILPLLEGKGKKVISQNIGELVASYEDDGKIGKVKPKSKKHAQKIAVAIALDKAKKADGHKSRGGGKNKTK